MSRSSMNTYSVRFRDVNLPILYDTFTYQSPEEFMPGQRVWIQTANGLEQAILVKKHSSAVTALILKGPWVPRCYSTFAEKGKQIAAARSH
jgi:hypothetical protein